MLENLFIDSPLKGTLIELADVDDEIFSGGAAGDIITRGQVLLTFDPLEISRAGFDATTPVVVTNPENFGDIVFGLGGRKIFAQRQKKCPGGRDDMNAIFYAKYC